MGRRAGGRQTGSQATADRQVGRLRTLGFAVKFTEDVIGFSYLHLHSKLSFLFFKYVCFFSNLEFELHQ